MLKRVIITVDYSSRSECRNFGYGFFNGEK